MRPTSLRGLVGLCAVIALTVLATAAGRGQGDVEALLTKGEQLRGRGDTSGARTAFEQALAASRQVGLSRGEGVALYNLGAIAADFGQYDRAWDHYTDALAIWRKLGAEREEALTLMGLGDICLAREESERARSYYAPALLAFQRLGLEDAEAEVLSRLGAAASAEGDYRQAQTLYGEALTTFQKLGRRQAEARLLTNMGNACHSSGRNDEAVGYYRQALAIQQELKLEEDEWQTLHNLGLASSDLLRYEDALAYHQQALAICRKLGLGHGEAAALLNLGALAYEMGRLEQAADLFQQAAAVFHGLSLANEEAKSLQNLGRVADDRGHYDQALSYYQSALEVCQDLGPGSLSEAIKLGLADVCLSQGQLERARETLKGVSPDSVRWGRYYLLAGDSSQAAAQFSRGSERDDISRRIACQIGLGLAEEARGEWEPAAAAYRRAIDLIEEARVRTPASERSGFFAGKDLGFPRLEAYEGLVRVLHGTGRDDEAFYWSEHTKARVLVEALAHVPFAAPMGLPEDLREQEDGLANQVAALSKLLAERPDQRAALQSQLAPLRAQQEALVARLRREYPEYASLRYPQPLHAPEVTLHPQEVLLAYEVTEPESFAFLLRGGKVVRVFAIARPRGELSDLVRKYRAGFTSVRAAARLRDLPVGLGEQLYQLLLAPALAAVQPGEQVVVVPDEMIGLLPLEALVERAGQVQWQKGEHGPYPEGVRFVGESRSFSYWQSATAMTAVRRLHARVAGVRTLVVADPVLDEADPRLRGAKPAPAPLPPVELAESLRGVYGPGIFQRLGGSAELLARLRALYGRRLKALTGLEASKGRLKRERLGEYAQLIFATHGVLGGDVPWLRQPALVLSQVGNPAGETGYLTMAEVMDLKLQADVVALMACETGAGPAVGGEGVMAMGRAFQYAGARSVLASLWKAEDASTNLLTESFFQQLAQSQDKLAALQAARQRLREAGYRHPFYWANFVLIGEQAVAANATEHDRQQ